MLCWFNRDLEITILMLAQYAKRMVHFVDGLVASDDTTERNN